MIRLSLLAPALALLAAGFVSACGHRGSLERPPPMWGDRSQPMDEDQRRQNEQEDATDNPSERTSSPR
ncbi:MAG: argininosuccinate lyase [Hyphomonadaceae bacterium]